MNKNAAFHGFANYRRVSAWLVSLAAAAMLFACLASSAVALLGLLDTLNVLSLPAALPTFNVCPAA